MAGSRSVCARTFFAFSISRFFKRFGSSLAYLSILVPGLAFAQAQMSTPGSFAVSPSGAATYTIPIQVPPGTAGMQPNLALTYNSQAGNGLAGVGWSLAGLSAIHRCPRTIVQDGVTGSINYDANDRFCLDGARLFRINAGLNYGAPGQEYRTQIESFTKVISYGGTEGNPSYFKAWTKSGQIMEFGNTEDSRVQAATQPRGVARSEIRLWAVNKIVDRAGNYLSLQYYEDQNAGIHVPIWIGYTGNSNTGEPGYAGVQPIWQARPDVETSFEAGSQIQMFHRLDHIKIFTSPGAGTFVKMYKLTYEATLSPSTKRSRLSSLVECSDVAQTSCLRPTQLSWQGSGSIELTSGSNINTGNGFTELKVLDANGDGKSDLVQIWNNNGRLWTLVYLSTGSGFAAQNWEDRGQGYTPTEVADFNGDGKGDLVQIWNDSGRLSFIPHISNGTGFSYAPGFDTGQGYTDVKVMDVNSDGRSDLVQTRDIAGRLWTLVHLSTGTGFATQTWENRGEGYTPTVVGDINGDGKSDLIQVWDNAGRLSLIPHVSTGTGFVSGSNFNSGNAFTEIKVMDVNGDGKSDFVQTWNNAGRLWTIVYHSTGSGFAARSWENRGEGYTPTEVADINGDGKSDLIQIWDNAGRLSFIFHISNGSGFINTGSFHSGQGFTALKVLDANGDGKSDFVQTWNDVGRLQLIPHLVSGLAEDLVTNVTSGLGAQTTVSYKPLTDSTVYNKGTSASYPYVDIQAPIYVVSNTSSSNGVGGARDLRYVYRNAIAQLQGVGMMGFRAMETYDDQLQLLSTTWFRTDWPYQGLVDAAQSVTYSGAMLSRRDTTFSIAFTYPGVYFVSPNTVTEKIYSAINNSAGAITGSTLLNTVTTTTVFGEATQYGNPTKITVDSGGGYSKVTDNLYLNDAANWILGRLTEAGVTYNHPIAPVQTRRSSFTYSPTTGFLTSETIEPCPRATIPGLTIAAACDNKLTLTTSYGYDSFGNKNSATASGGLSGNISYVAPRTTTTSYAATSANPNAGRFPTSTTNALNQSETREFDNRFGGMTKLVGPNSIPTSWSYDGFGRKTLETRADGTSSTISYNLCSSGCSYYIYFTSTGQPDSQQYFDILNRNFRSFVRGFDGTWIRTSGGDFDNLGRVITSYRTAYEPNPNPGATRFTYDNLGRVMTEKLSDGVGTGNYGLATYSYQGLETTITKSTGRSGITQIVNRTVKNAQGQTIKVINADGSTIPSQITYEYDAVGNLRKTFDQNNVRTSDMQYNIRGFKISMYDLNMNSWSYTYDALGQLKTQVDGKTQQTTIAFDLLGRMTSRITSAFTSNWYYDKYANNSACNKGIGKLCEVTATNGFHRTFLYDSLGRGLETTTYLNSIPYTVTNTYGGCANGVGKVCSVTYPFTYGTMARVKMNNNYNITGYLTSITDASNSAVLWSLTGPTAMDADGNITKETLGNGLITDRLYSVTTGRIQTIKTGNSLIQNLAYGFDHLGDLVSRNDGVNNVNETFAYDALNRLTGSAITGATALTKSYGYSSTGNLNYKSDVGTLVYPLSYEVRNHAVKSVTGTVNGLVNPTYEYDSVGNLLREKTGTTIQREITWTGFNMPSRITKGSSTIDFLYDADHARIKETRSTGATVDSQTYFVNAGNALFFEIETKGAITEWKHYIHAPSGLLMMRSIKSNTTAKTDVYFHKDHLGSITTITNNIGAILEQNSFDAFGKRRNVKRQRRHHPDQQPHQARLHRTRNAAGSEHDPHERPGV